MGNRAGQGYGVPKPKRARCPECSKKGVTEWKVTPFGLVRHCQFCGQAWGEESWKLAKAEAAKLEVCKSFDECKRGTPDSCRRGGCSHGLARIAAQQQQEARTDGVNPSDGGQG